MTSNLPTLTLPPEQIAAYQRDGFLALDTLVTPTEVAWLRAIYDRLFDAQAGRAAGDQFDLAGTDAEHHNRTLHYTGANHSPIPRRAYILIFGRADAAVGGTGFILDTPAGDGPPAPGRAGAT